MLLKIRTINAHLKIREEEEEEEELVEAKGALKVNINQVMLSK